MYKSHGCHPDNFSQQELERFHRGNQHLYDTIRFFLDNAFHHLRGVHENKEIDVDTLNILQTCKTGALIEAGCVMGVILGDKLEAIPFAADYAQAMGRAFQIVDDILDVTGTFEEFGKPIGSDSEQHKNTYVSLLGLDKSEQIAKQLTVQALGHLKYFEDSVFLTELTSDMLTRRS